MYHFVGHYNQNVRLECIFISLIASIEKFNLILGYEVCPIVWGQRKHLSPADLQPFAIIDYIL